MQYQRYPGAGELCYELPLAGPARPWHPASRADPLRPYRLMHRHATPSPSRIIGRGKRTPPRGSAAPRLRRQPLPLDTRQPGESAASEPVRPLPLNLRTSPGHPNVPTDTWCLAHNLTSSCTRGRSDSGSMTWFSMARIHSDDEEICSRSTTSMSFTHFRRV